MANEKPTWEQLYVEAQVAVERAQKAIDDIAGWSGSSGNWPLQEASGRINAALEALRKPYPSDICPECGGHLGGTSVGRIEQHTPTCSRFPL